MFSLARMASNDWGCLPWGRRPEIKIALVGIDGAGKSTALAGLLREPLDEVRPTIGFVTSQVRFRRKRLTVYDLGGGERIRGIWERYYSELHALIFVVDAFDRARLDEAARVLAATVAHRFVKGKTILILANMQNREGACTAPEVSELLRLDELGGTNCEFFVQPCALINSQGGRLDPGLGHGLRWLLSTVKLRMASDGLQDRVDADQAEQADLDRTERQEKQARIRARKEAAAAATASSGAAVVVPSPVTQSDQDRLLLSPPMTPLPNAITPHEEDPRHLRAPLPRELPPLSHAPPEDGLSSTSQTSSSLQAPSIVKVSAGSGPGGSKDDAQQPQRRRRSARRRRRSNESSPGLESDDEQYNGEPSPAQLAHMCDLYETASGFRHAAALTMVASAWQKLKAQMQVKKRFNLKRVVQRLHDGWGCVVHELWDTSVYGPEPPRLPQTGPQGVWPEVLFSSRNGFLQYWERKRLALTQVEDLPEETLARYHAVARRLHQELVRVFPKAAAFPVRGDTMSLQRAGGIVTDAEA